MFYRNPFLLTTKRYILELSRFLGELYYRISLVASKLEF